MARENNRSLGENLTLGQVNAELQTNRPIYRVGGVPQ